MTKLLLTRRRNRNQTARKSCGITIIGRHRRKNVIIEEKNRVGQIMYIYILLVYTFTIYASFEIFFFQFD